MSNKSIRRALLAGTTLAALIGLSAPSLALAAAAGPGNQVEEVVVTAQKRSENIQQVPLSIQAFTGKAIKDLGIKSSADLGRITSNVDIALPAGPGNQPIISIRGIGLNDYDTNNAGPNGVYVDEVYLSAPASQTFQTFDLERIEVLKGPQGTLYGRNSSGGAINFITNKPTDTPSGDFHIEYGNFNTFNFEGGIGGPIAHDLDGRVAVVVNESDGDFHNDLTGNHENGQNNVAARLQLLWKPTDKFKLLFNIHGGMVDNRPTEYRHYGAFDPNSGDVCSVSQMKAGGCVDLFGYGTPKNFYDGSYNRQEHLKVNSFGSYLRGDYNLGGVTLTSITSFEHNDKLHPEDSDASPNRLLEINFGVRSNTITQEFRATGSGERYDWVGGLYYLHEDLSQNQPIAILLDGDNFFGPGKCDAMFANNPPTPDDLLQPISSCAQKANDHSHQVTDAYAAFGQGNYSLLDNLKLTFGARVTGEQRSFHYVGSVQYQYGGEDNFTAPALLADSTKSLSNTAFSWRTGLDYHFTKDIHAYVTVSTGYKSGDFNGSFLSTDPLQIQRQLEPVKPENVLAYEVGVKGSLFENRVVFDLAAFYNQYDDMQVFVLVPPVGNESLPVNVLANAPKAHTEGIDAQLSLRPFSGLTITNNLGILDTRLDKFLPDLGNGQKNYSGNQLPLSPHVTFSTMADYRVPVGEGALDFQFSATFKSHQFFDISNDPYTTQNDYWLENLRVAYQLPGRNWEVAAYVRNLSDQKYLLDAFDLINPFGLVQGITGMPRTFGAEVNYRF